MQNLAQLTTDGKEFKERYLWKVWKEVRRDFLLDTKERQDVDKIINKMFLQGVSTRKVV